MENPSKKRTAARELNHDNWNDEDEPEDAGTFRQAPSEVIQGRVIKQARRRMAGSTDESKPKLFSGFGGFGAAATPSANAFSNITFTKSTTESSETPKKEVPSFGGFGAANNAFSNVTFTKQPAESESPKKENGTASKPVTDLEDDGEKEYMSSLTELNKNVSVWITDHVNKNPCCLLTPIFSDYEKHHKELEAKRNSKKASKKLEPPSSLTTSSSTNTFLNFKSGDSETKPTADAPKPSFSFFGNGSSSSSSTSSAATPTSTFSFKPATSSPSSTTTISSTPAASVPFSFSSKPPATSPAESAPAPFSFKPATTSPSTGTAPASLFSFGASNTFGSSKPVFGSSATTTTSGFSFGFGAKPVAAPEKNDEADKEGGAGDDDEDQPPVVEVKQVKEDDAFYSIKCKLFYKKDGSFADKGVGMLHLKKINDDKTQLVVRADTSLGNILLNIMLPPKMSIVKQGKNNVMIVCIPNPPIDPKTPPAPTPMLLRVKTSEDADELITKLTEATQ